MICVLLFCVVLFCVVCCVAQPLLGVSVSGSQCCVGAVHRGLLSVLSGRGVCTLRGLCDALCSDQDFLASELAALAKNNDNNRAEIAIRWRSIAAKIAEKYNKNNNKNSPLNSGAAKKKQI